MMSLTIKLIALSLIAQLCVSATKPDADTTDDLELLKVVVVNRHGHRSPNSDYWTLCPDDFQNRDHYDVGSGMLTGLGFQEELTVGAYLRRTYGRFIGKEYNPRQHYMRATGDIRTMQSCMLVSEGVFPDGFGPRGFVPSRPQAVPVFTDITGNDNLLTDSACAERSLMDKSTWMQTVGRQILYEPYNRKLVTRLMTACGADPSVMFAPDDTLKSIVDGLIFNSAYGEDLLHGSLADSDLVRLRNLSTVILLGKLFSTDEQKTYMASDLPYQLLKAFGEIATLRLNSSLPEEYIKFDMFTGHREIIYAMGAFFGIQFDFKLLSGELPTAAAVVFELLYDPRAFEGNAKFFVRPYAYAPSVGRREVTIPFCKRPHLCSLNEFIQAYNERVQRTGSWETLCGVSS